MDVHVDLDGVINNIIDENNDNFRTTAVSKDIEVEIDLGNLLVSDPNLTNFTSYRADKEQYLLDLARDNAQLLINRLWELPAENVDNVVVVKLPRPTTRIPREKPVPALKKRTKWEKFAAMKGIVNKKKKRMVFDEQSQSYKPSWGYKRANDETKAWVVEVPDQADPNEDQFEKLIKAKKERIAKNDLQRLRNVARNMKGKVPGIGLLPTTTTPDKDHLDRALIAAKTSNASMGMFTGTLPKEKKLKTGNVGKKRKFEPNFQEGGKEKKRCLDILSRLGEPQGIVDKQKAAKIHNKYQRDPEDGDNNRGKGKKFQKGKGGRSEDSFDGDRSFSSKSPGGGKKMAGRKGKGKSPGGKGKSPAGRGKSPGGKGRGKK